MTTTQTFQLDDNRQATAIIQLIINLIATGKAQDNSDKQYISCITPSNTIIAVALHTEIASYYAEATITGDAAKVELAHKHLIHAITDFPTLSSEDKEDMAQEAHYDFGEDAPF